jgi:S-adenosyl-L-methionine hydrolase (adenosine-forming)
MVSIARPVITLTTDFGLVDHFAGVMRGVILSISPNTTIVDIAHGIQSHDIEEAALVLRASYSFFPQGTIHVVVVDPGVGGARRPILMITENYAFVAPDNGVLSPVNNLEKNPQVYHLTAEEYFLKPVSNTFHGRDIFSPVAAWLSRGIAPSRFGPMTSSLVELTLPTVRKLGKGRMIGTVLRADKFGNLITNLSQADLSLPVQDSLSLVIEIGGRRVTRLRQSYAEAATDEIFAIWGSSGLLEIAANQASAAEILQARRNHEFEVELRSQA